MNIEKIFDKANWQKIEISQPVYKDFSKKISNKPGLYMIFSNVPANELKDIGTLEIKGSYNIPNRVIDFEGIPKSLVISQDKDELYCVYIGHQKNLRQRCKEHFNGSKGTACLSLFNYSKLRNYKWEFHYFELSNLDGYVDSKLHRNILESHLRVKFGWPCLCME
jgi:hypothetical protein